MTVNITFHKEDFEQRKKALALVIDLFDPFSQLFLSVNFDGHFSKITSFVEAYSYFDTHNEYLISGKLK